MNPHALQEARDRYQPWRSLYYYAWGKIALDPAYPEVARLLAPSSLPLLDIGAGMGLLASYLRAQGHTAPILGMDLDGYKIDIANQVLGAADARFWEGDALTAYPEHQGDVVMLDVLHYFDDARQQLLLGKIADSVAPGGLALIRVALNQPNWRFAMTRLEEWFVKFSRWIPTSGWNFPREETLARPFLERGFQVEARPMWGRTPFNSYLFVCRRVLIS